MSTKKTVESTFSFEYTRKELARTEISTHVEWIAVNERGSYASTTLADTHTRKYHGLLVKTLGDTGDRMVLLSHLDVEILSAGKTVSLASHRFPGALEPRGYGLLDGFSQTGTVVTRWTFGDVAVERELLLAGDRDTLLVRYRVTAGRAHQLRIRPLLAWRSMHHLGSANGWFRGDAFAEGAATGFHPYEGTPKMLVTSKPAAAFRAEPGWWHRFELSEEMRRGFDAWEDLFAPGVFTVDAEGDHAVTFAFDASGAAVPDPASLFDKEKKLAAARAAELAPAGADETETALRRSCEIFFVRPRGTWSVAAGYPWFGEWGRDAFIALPGLLEATGREADCLEVMGTFAAARRQGLIPNFLGSTDSHAYNSADASLWFLRACRMFSERSGVGDRIAESLWPAVAEIIEHFGRSTAPNVRLDGRTGLLSIGSPHTQLTWMDAQVFGQPVTPRHGMAVELNALWIDGLDWALAFAAARGLPLVGDAALWLKNAAEHFEPVFGDVPHGALADVVHEGGPDGAVRPNMLFAVGLAKSALSKARMKTVVQVAATDLVTPVGLRTLSPRDSRYRGHYEGDGPSRDGAYHQGTVWPWLTGIYVDAALKVAGPARAADEAARLLVQFQPLFSTCLRDYGAGHLAEVFDAEPPHRAGGTPAQAWSSAEVFRAWKRLRAAVA